MHQQVAEAFKKLYFGKRTGVLTCVADEHRRAVTFQSGFVVAASSSLTSDRLGEVMIRHGRLTEEQFEDASKLIKRGWKLGEILAELKIIEDGDIEQFVRLQLLDISCTQLVSPPKKLSFAPVSAVDTLLEAPLSVADILMEAARRTPSVEKITENLHAETRKLGFPTDPLKRFQDVSLTPEEAFVLSRVDGTQTTADIFTLSPLSEEATARTLYGLLTAELIEPEGTDVVVDEAKLEKKEPAPAAPPPAKTPEPQPDANDTSQTIRKEDKREHERATVELLYQEMQFQDHWQVLNIERSASNTLIKEAFFRRAKQFHPDRYRAITEPEFQEKLSFVFRRVNEAYETLSSSESKARYESLLDKERQYAEAQEESVAGTDDASGGGMSAQDRADSAADLYRRAKAAYGSEDFWTCIELAREAVDLAPETAAYYNLLGLALAKNPKWRQDAETNLKIATNLDPFRASYVLDLAKLYEQGGLHLRAQKTLEKARAIDPSVGVPD